MRYLEELERKGRDANPFFVLMGVELGDYGDGEAVLAMEVRRDMLNGDGWLQGGLYAALCDEAMALAICTVLEEGESIATISETTSFFKGVQDGNVIASARVIRKGRRIAFSEGKVTDESGSLLSQTGASFAVIRR